MGEQGAYHRSQHKSGSVHITISFASRDASIFRVVNFPPVELQLRQLRTQEHPQAAFNDGENCRPGDDSRGSFHGRLTNMRHRYHSRRYRSRFGGLRPLMRAVVIEGMGIALLATLVGVPLLGRSQCHVSCLDAEPSAIDSGLQIVLAKIGLIPDID